MAASIWLKPDDEIELLNSRKGRIGCPVDVGPQYTNVDRDLFSNCDRTVDTRWNTDVLAHIAHMQGQVTTDQSTYLITVVEALYCLKRAKHEQGGQYNEYRQKTERQGARDTIKHRL